MAHPLVAANPKPGAKPKPARAARAASRAEPAAPPEESEESEESDEYKRFVAWFVHFYLKPRAQVSAQTTQNMKKTTFVLVAGLGNEVGPTYFANTRMFLHESGVQGAAYTSYPSSFTSIDASADRLADKLSKIKGDITLIVHSMGINSVLIALFKHPELIPRVRIVTFNGAPMGSPHARDYVSTGNLPTNNALEWAVAYLLSPFVNKDKLAAVKDLVPENIRERWQKMLRDKPELLQQIGARLYWLSSFTPPKTTRGQRIQSEHGANDTAVALEHQHLEVVDEDGNRVKVGTELIRVIAQHGDLVGPTIWPSLSNLQEALHKAIFAHLFSGEHPPSLNCPLRELAAKIPPIAHELHPMPF